MSFRTFDLNLLRIFDAIMTEQNLTRAAERLATTQPAVSNALKRLRETLEDELLVRTAHGMKPTARAEELWPAVRSALSALEAAIAALKPHVEGKLIIVFGAGGDRDKGKRAPMGAAATRLSDIAIVTDDNPRTEDPASIRREVMEGAVGAMEIGDRRAAIAEAIRLAGAGDIVLIAGKGHETGQLIGDLVLPFDDALVARECAA